MINRLKIGRAPAVENGKNPVPLNSGSATTVKTAKAMLKKIQHDGSVWEFRQ
jgi:hypothetical protein